MDGFPDHGLRAVSKKFKGPSIQLSTIRLLLRFQMKLMQEAMIKGSKHDGDARQERDPAEERVTTCKNLASGRLQFAERSHA